MLAKSFPGIRTNSQAKSGTEPATKWGCHTDTPTTTTAEITTDQTGRSSVLFIGGSIVPPKSGYRQVQTAVDEVSQNDTQFGWPWLDTTTTIPERSTCLLFPIRLAGH